MTERRGGLGKGLAALIPTGPAEEGDGPADVSRESVPPEGQETAGSSSHRERGWFIANSAMDSGVTAGANGPSGEVAGAVYREVPVSAVTSNPRQPRQVFDEESLAELQHSIQTFGLMQPIVVRVLGDEAYELVMGERRLRAAQQAELAEIPAIVRQTADDAMLRDALLENIHRVQLNPLEEAAAYQQLLDEFEVTHDELAERIGRSRPVITNTIRLMRLPLPVQRRVAAGVLSAGHARALLTLEDPDTQEELAARVISEGLSVRATEEAVTLSKNEPSKSKQQPANPASEKVAEFEQVASRLSDTFDTRVKVDAGKRKGRLIVEFGSFDDLERIVGMMDPAAAEYMPRHKDV